MMQYLRRDKVLVASVPQIEGLTVEDMLQMAKSSPAILKHLPDESDWVHMDRKWISDVIFTLDKANFQKAIDKAVKARKERLEQSRNLMVEMRPEFASALHACQSFSSEHGRAASLIKSSSKRKRTRAELDEVRSEEELLKQDRFAYLAGIKRLRDDKAAQEAKMGDVPVALMQQPAGGAGAAPKQGQAKFNI